MRLYDFQVLVKDIIIEVKSKFYNRVSKMSATNVNTVLKKETIFPRLEGVLRLCHVHAFS